MNKMVDIFKDSRGKLSSKRVFGGLGFVAAIFIIAFGIETQNAALLLLTSAGMLGFDAALDIFKK
jgi:hypothetical protein